MHGFPDDLNWSAGINYLTTLRLVSCYLQIGVPDPLEEFDALFLKAIELAAIRSPLQSQRWIQIQDQREVRAQLILNQLFKLCYFIDSQAAAASLVSVSRIGKAIAQYPAASRQGWLDYIVQVLRASRKNQ